MMNNITNQQLIEQMLTAKGMVNDTDFIEKEIQDDVHSANKAIARIGVNYYDVKNEKILGKKRYYYMNGVKTLDEYVENNIMPSAFNRTIVDQHVNFLNLNELTFKPGDKPDSESGFNNFKELVGLERFKGFIKRLKKHAAKKSAGVAYYYLDEEGNFKYKDMDYSELIFIYDTATQEKLITVIRYYTIIQVIDDEEVKLKRVEVYDTEKITRYIETEEGNYRMIFPYVQGSDGYYDDPTIIANPEYYWTSYNTKNVEEIKVHDFGMVPFSILWNNESHQADIELNKQYIDAYDQLSSEIQDEFSDSRTNVYKLKGYQLDPNERGMFRHNLKIHGVVPLDSDGELEVMDSKVVYENPQKRLSDLRENVFDFGMGVDTKVDNLGNAPSGESLKFQFSNLELKAKDSEEEIRTFVKNSVEIANVYLTEKENKKPVVMSDLSMDFTYNTIINLKDLLEGNEKATGVVSKRTQLENHPYVKDVEEEMERIENEEMAFEVEVVKE
jgi:SPP1 family phage portal protein